MDLDCNGDLALGVWRQVHEDSAEDLGCPFAGVETPCMSCEEKWREFIVGGKPLGPTEKPKPFLSQ